MNPIFSSASLSELGVFALIRSCKRKCERLYQPLQGVLPYINFEVFTCHGKYNSFHDCILTQDTKQIWEVLNNDTWYVLITVLIDISPHNLDSLHFCLTRRSLCAAHGSLESDDFINKLDPVIDGLFVKLPTAGLELPMTVFGGIAAFLRFCTALSSAAVTIGTGMLIYDWIENWLSFQYGLQGVLNSSSFIGHEMSLLGTSERICIPLIALCSVIYVLSNSGLEFSNLI